MKLPKIGMRIFKTGIAILITAAIMKYFFNTTPFFACIGALVAIETSTKKSLIAILNRNLGTLIGGLIGTFLSLVTSNIVILSFGSMIVIYLLLIFKRKDSIIPGCIVYLAVVYLNTQDTAHIYAFKRISETFFGSIIGIIVNLLIKNPNKEKTL